MGESESERGRVSEVSVRVRVEGDRKKCRVRLRG